MPAPANLYTPERLIKQALRDCGRLQYGSTPSDEVYEDAQTRLNDMINAWQTQGLKLWLNQIRNVVPVEGQGDYQIGPNSSPAIVKPMRIIAGWYATIADNVWTPLTMLGGNDYYNMSSLSVTGITTSFFVQKRLTDLHLYLWPVPNEEMESNYIKILCQDAATSWVDLEDDISFPVEWFQALRWGLADELCSGQPGLIMDRCERKAQQFKRILEDWDVEDAATRISPDTTQMAPSRFGR